MKLNRFATFAWVVLAYTVGVIIWGAFVRATGSGAGCGSHWPLCNGEVIPRSPQLETLIELTHRLTSGIALPLVIVLAVWSFKREPKDNRLIWSACLSVFFMVTEALVGAGLVRFELVADNASMERAIVMSFHLANTFLLLAVLTATSWWASGGGSLSLKGHGSLVWLFALGLCGMIVLGISGAVAALGDTLFPAKSLAEGFRQDFSPTAHFMIRLRFLHPLIAVAVSIFLITLAIVVSLFRPNQLTKRLSLVISLLIVVQLVAGVVNVYLLAPVWMQLVHLLLADVIWIVLLLLTASVLVQRPKEKEALGQLSFNPAKV